jgi:hypothetical protein
MKWSAMCFTLLLCHLRQKYSDTRQKRPLSFEALDCTTIAVNNIFHIVLPAYIKIVVLLLAKGINNQAFN